MTDHRATFEHADLTEPRREHGYCTDDMARVLVVATREPDADGEVNGLAGKALTFLNDAQAYDGACRNRMDHGGPLDRSADHRRPLGPHASGGSAPPPPTATSAWCAGWPSSSSSARPRPVAVAAGDGLRGDRCRRAAYVSNPSTRRHARLLTDYAAAVPSPNGDADWPWPEPRLTYANAVLPEAMIAAGVALDDAESATARPRPVGVAARPRDARRSPVAHPRRRPWTAGRPPRRSTSSRSRWPPSPMRAPAPRPPIRGRSWPDGHSCRRGVVPRRQRRRPGHVGPGDRRRLRRPARRRGEPQPGRGVDPRRALHPAARAALFALSRNDDRPEPGLVTRSAQRIAADPSPRDHATVRPGPGGLRAPGVPRRSGASSASWP